MRAVLCLGRYGDICNSLPVAYKVYKEDGEKPYFIVSSDYADILDGVSYVETYVYNGPFYEPGKAYDEFREKFRQIHVHVTQVYCTPSKMDQVSFCKQMWEYAGFQDDFSKVPLIFDKRDEEREKRLWQTHILGHKNVILVNFLGHSSPLRAFDTIWESLQRAWSWKANIVNLAQIRCHRFYDLLGLYDHAQLLVTADTGTLHLAQASAIPSIQFITDSPTIWHGSIPKGNYKMTVRYHQVIPQMSKIHAAIAEYML